MTAGGEVVSRVRQNRPSIHPRTYIGPGKAREISQLEHQLALDLVVIDTTLRPSQQHHLEAVISAKILDRPALILDIFAQRARSSEGKLQVELAQLNYLLPRLVGRGVELSRLGGGIGTRGPGETKLEVDRRRIRQRIRRLNKDLESVGRHRKTQRKQRRRDAFAVALVGYTNAGKSTLLNKLTKAQAFVEDKLFATLDPTARRMAISGYGPVVLADTVGFIRSLPPQLVAAFRSTLEEVGEAELLLHVIDASHTQKERQIEAVEKVLSDLGASKIPRVNVFNKMDLLAVAEVERLKQSSPDGTVISAVTGEGLAELVNKIGDRVRSDGSFSHFLVPFEESQVLVKIYDSGRVVSRTETQDGTLITVGLSEPVARSLKKYEVSEANASRLRGQAPTDIG